MMDLIDRNKALAETWKEPSYSDPLNVLAEIRERLKALPTIEQPEIIRCRDCQYWESGTRYGKCKLTYISVTGDYYCAAAAERRDE